MFVKIASNVFWIFQEVIFFSEPNFFNEIELSTKKTLSTSHINRKVNKAYYFKEKFQTSYMFVFFSKSNTTKISLFMHNYYMKILYKISTY